MLSSTVFANTLVGTSYASQIQTQTQAPPPANQTPRPSSQVPTAPTPICSPNPPALQSGSTGAKVAELQRALTQVGYGSLLGKSGVDGKFGPSTQNAVKKFQQDNRIPVDGKLGPITWGTLCNIIPNSFIVQLKSASPGSFREIMGTLTPQLAKAGGEVVATYDEFGMFNMLFEGPLAKREQFIKSLRTHPAVQGVFNDKIVTAAQQSQKQVIPTGIDRVDADKSGGAKSGDGVGLPVNADIAILDTGVSTHDDLNVVRCFDLSIPPYDSALPCYDDNGHGTHVAGIAAAIDNNIGVVGTAPGARIWSVQVLDKNAVGKDSNMMRGLTFVTKHFKDIEVVNISVQAFGFDIPVTFAITMLVNLGVTVVVPAGNQNIDARYMWPANVAAAITVSAITDTDGKCGGAGKPFVIPGEDIPHQRHTTGSVRNLDDFFLSISNFGSMVDLAAPGANIATTDNTGGYTMTLGSTSFAAAHVAGAAALLRALGADPLRIEYFAVDLTGTKAPDTGNPLLPCNGAGRGYFNDEYPRSVPVLTDTIKEPLLYMGPFP